MTHAPVILFSDFTCPFSYVTEAALRRIDAFPIERIEFRAFELYPSPAPLPDSVADAASVAPLAALADEAGVRIERREFVPRTAKAHEAARFARGHGREPALRDAVFRAYWEEGRDIGRIDVLVALGAGVGLEAEDLKIALDIDAFADEIGRERLVAEGAGVRHTPTLVVGEGAEAVTVVGAHPLEEIRTVLGGR